MLLDSLQIASKSLNASSLAIQVAGQNLTNAGQAGYVREQLVTGTSSPLTQNGYALGTGVDVSGVVQMIDTYLEERLRTSQSDAMNTATQSGVYDQLEFILNELTDTDLSTQLTSFFNAIGNVLNQPEDLTIRQTLVDEAEKLTTLIGSMSTSILNARIDINNMIGGVAEQINLLTEEIANLNNLIAQVEAGKEPGVEAVGLRDQRLVALSNLSSLVNIKTHEDDAGVVTVYCGGDMLVSSNGARRVTVAYTDDPHGELSLAEIRYESNNAPLDVYSGKLNGYYEGRDNILGEFSSQLDEYASLLINEFNNLYTSGQGLSGYDQISGLTTLTEYDVPLDQLDLPGKVQSGVFSIIVQNTETLVETKREIQIPLSDSGAVGMTLEDLVQAINENVEGVTASINVFGKFEILADSPEVNFAFSGDTSGVLAALGLNTFFTGTDARTIGINSVVANDPKKIAVSANGIGADTENGVLLAAIPETSLAQLDNKSITEAYRLSVTSVMSKAGTVRAVATGDVAYYASLQSQRDSISGVNVDEETLAIFSSQRIFQASSKLITAINEMLQALIAM